MDVSVTERLLVECLLNKTNYYLVHNYGLHIAMLLTIALVLTILKQHYVVQIKWHPHLTSSCFLDYFNLKLFHSDLEWLSKSEVFFI